MERDRLFIEDLAETTSGLRPPPDAEPSPQDVTTQALGEEGDQGGDDTVTTDALGEEGDQGGDDTVTTDALGEEGDQFDDYHDVDIEEYDQVVTTDALGEEGDQPEDDDVPDVPIDPGWGTGEPVATTDALGESGDLPDDVTVDVPIDFPIPIDPGPGDGDIADEEFSEVGTFVGETDEEVTDGADYTDDAADFGL